MLWPLTGYTVGMIPAWLTVVILVLEVGIRVVMIGVIPGNRHPTTAMAWLLAIFLIPVVALPLYLLVGTRRLSRRRREVQRSINERLLEETRHLELSDSVLAAPRARATVRLNRTLGAFPIHGGNDLHLLDDYAASCRWIAEAVDGATEYVHVLFYIVGDDPDYAGPVLDAMERAAERGVRVCLLYDHLGTWRVPGYRALLRRLRKSGIEFHPVLPLRPLKRRFSRLDLRNHRKIVVVDGRVAFTGSMNLIEPHYHRASARRMGRRWVELNAVTTGPVVTSLDIVFASDWYLETGEDLAEEMAVDLDTDERASGGVLAQVVPSGPGFPAENNLHLFNDLLYTALDRVLVCTPYLVPDESLLGALTGAASRGVTVSLMVSERADQFLVHHAQQSYYQALLEAGVRIHRYPDPNVLHSKFVIVDDETLVIGSSNMDLRSFNLNAEVTLMLIDAGVVREAETVFEGYRAVASELTLAEWQGRPVMVRYLDNVCRLASGLL